MLKKVFTYATLLAVFAFVPFTGSQLSANEDISIQDEAVAWRGGWSGGHGGWGSGRGWGGKHGGWGSSRGYRGWGGYNRGYNYYPYYNYGGSSYYPYYNYGGSSYYPYYYYSYPYYNNYSW